ncbi:MAG: copper-binding protein [Candidatus Rokuibacteriota bacterium]
MRIAAAMLLVTALAAAACGEGTPAGGHPGRGVVQSVDAAAGQITIDHGEIPGLMKGMTMTFHVSDPALLEGISPQQEVDFGVVEKGSRYVVVRIEPVPRGGAGRP